jgi:23S rRNA (uracil1939-C5)-methyltransferase
MIYLKQGSEKMEYLITDLNHLGQGITRIDNKITFVPKTVSGDIINLEITKSHKNYNEAKLLKIVKPSPDRIEYKCPYYNKCGGCNIANLEYTNQLKYKKEKVINIFKKYNKIDINPTIIASDEILHYRNKITLQYNEKLGLYEEKTHNIIEIQECLLMPQKVNDIIKLLSKYNYNTSLQKIVIRIINNQVMINIIAKDIPKSLIEILKNLDVSVYHNSKYISGNKVLIETLNNYKFSILPDSFFQINKKQTINLYNQIVEYANPQKEDKVLDLYCGVGTIGIYLSKYCKEVLGIEINKSSIENANINKKLNNVENISFIEADVSKVLSMKYKADIIIVDPPRSGLNKNTIETLIKINPKKIVYVSCDPITLSRDINLLKNNYILKDIKLYDMFPETYHVECVTVLCRKAL